MSATKTGCIRRPAGARWIAMRDEYYDISKELGAKHPNCAAAMIAWLEGWTNKRIGTWESDRRAMKKSRSDQSYTYEEHLWFYRTRSGIVDDLFGLFGKDKIRWAIEWLKEVGLVVTRSNPNKGWDQTLQYKLCIERLQSLVNRWETGRSLTEEEPEAEGETRDVITLALIANYFFRRGSQSLPAATDEPVEPEEPAPSEQAALAEPEEPEQAALAEPEEPEQAALAEPEEPGQPAESTEEKEKSPSEWKVATAYAFGWEREDGQPQHDHLRVQTMLTLFSGNSKKHKEFNLSGFETPAHIVGFSEWYQMVRREEIKRNGHTPPQIFFPIPKTMETLKGRAEEFMSISQDNRDGWVSRGEKILEAFRSSPEAGAKAAEAIRQQAASEDYLEKFKKRMQAGY